MKLIILHLSDMHFSKKNSYQPVNIDAIVAALQQSVFEVQHTFIQSRIVFSRNTFSKVSLVKC